MRAVFDSFLFFADAQESLPKCFKENFKHLAVSASANRTNYNNTDHNCFQPLSVFIGNIPSNTSLVINLELKFL